jgi:hypothetical protein
MAETIEVNGTEVIVEETDDGYEASEYEPEEVFAVKASDGHDRNPYGFVIPLSGADQFEIEKDVGSDLNPHYAAWNTEADVGDMKSTGANSAKKDDYDGYAAVEEVELVTVEV